MELLKKGLQKHLGKGWTPPLLGRTQPVSARTRPIWDRLGRSTPEPSPPASGRILLLLLLLLLHMLAFFKDVICQIVTLSCRDKHENYIYSSWLDCTWKIGLNHEVETIVCLIIKFHLQLSCQDKMILSFIDSGFNTTGWSHISLIKIKIKYKHNTAAIFELGAHAPAPPVPTCCNPCPLHDSCSTHGLTAASTPLLPGFW